MAFVGRAAGCFPRVFGLTACRVGADTARTLNLGRFSVGIHAVRFGNPVDGHAARKQRMRLGRSAVVP